MGQKLAQIQLLDLQFFAPSPSPVGTMLQSTVTSGTKHGEVLELMLWPDLKKGSIFLPSNGRISANWAIAIYGKSLLSAGGIVIVHS